MHHPVNDTFVPEMTNELYLQRDNFIDPDFKGSLLVPIFFFYIFSVLTIVSYVRLMTTDITSHFYEEDEIEAEENI